MYYNVLGILFFLLSLGPGVSQRNRLIKDDGMFLLQAITIDDRYYEEASKTVDFIKKYIFPGCCIPSQEIISKHISKDTDYQLYHIDDITYDYALTLNHWLKNFRENIQEIKEMGYNEHFRRMWEYYLQYCEGGFLERAIGVGQFLYVKQGAKQLKKPPSYE